MFRSFLPLALMFVAACSTKLNSTNAHSTVKPFYHSAGECPSMSDLPKTDSVRDLQSRGSKGVLLRLSIDTGAMLKIVVDGKEHAETFEVVEKSVGASKSETMVYRAGCHDKGILIKFDIGGSKGSWEIDHE